MFVARSIDYVWFNLLDKITSLGRYQSPGGKPTKEILGNQTVVDMSKPIITNPHRKLGYKFLAGEAWWILSGDDQVSTISPYSREISRFSDDGETFFGAYGPRIIDQMNHIIDSLVSDDSSRQAVINIWRENPPKSKDIPCSLSVQFLIRDNKLHCMYTMRSSDAWLGWVYDVFNFTMLTSAVLLELTDTYPDKFPQLQLGNLVLTAGSQHLYESDAEGVAKVLMNDPETRDYPEWKPRSYFKNADELVRALKHAADTQGALVWAQEGYSHAPDA